MPAYRFLFEKRKVRQASSPEALALPPELAPGPDYEVVPKQQALALAAYLTSLRADAPLFVAPLSAVPPASGNTTNAPAGAEAAATNAAPANPAAK